MYVLARYLADVERATPCGASVGDLWVFAEFHLGPENNARILIVGVAPPGSIQTPNEAAPIEVLPLTHTACANTDTHTPPSDAKTLKDPHIQLPITLTPVVSHFLLPEAKGTAFFPAHLSPPSGFAMPL